MFEKIKCFILDMDGTIYLGNELFPFTKDFLKKVEETGREYYFFTNNSSKSQRAYIEKLGKLGIPIKKDQMMISSHVIIKYLKEHYDGKSIYVLGTPSLIQEFQYFDMNDRCAGHSGDPCGVYDTGADTVYREKSGGIRPYRGAGGVY